MDVIYYHDHCSDGWCAAFVAHIRYPKAKLVPLSYGSVDLDDLFEEAKGKNVLMLDFSLKSLIANNTLNRVAKSLLILDHHKTAKEIIGDVPYAVFDMERSGAGLAFDYIWGNGYNPAIARGMMPLPRPWWVSYTEDQDLWRFALPNSRAVNAYLNVQTRTVEAWQQMLKSLGADEKEALSEVTRLGTAILQHVNYVIEGGMGDLQAGLIDFEGQRYTVGVVNNGHVCASEIGEAVYNSGLQGGDFDIAMIWREDKSGKIRFSLRSKIADVGAYAKTFPGGGGHKAASGFELDLQSGRDLIDTILGRKYSGTTSRCC